MSEIINLVKFILKSIDENYILKDEFKFYEDKSVKTKVVKNRYYTQDIYKIFNNKKFLESQAYLKALHELKNIYIANQITLDFHMSLWGIIDEIFNTCKVFSSKQQIISIINSHVASKLSKKIEVKIEYAIEGVCSTGIKKIKYSENIELVKFTLPMKDNYINNKSKIFNNVLKDIEAIHLLNSNYVLRISKKVSIGDQESFNPSESEAKNLISALRIAIPKNIGCNVKKYLTIPKILSYTGPVLTKTNSELSVLRHSKAILTLSSINISKKLFKIIMDPKLPNEVIYSLQRFNRSFNRNYLEDAIIDLTVALETLLVSDNKSEITLKMRIMTAGILDSEGVFLSDHITHLYDIRSKIAHTGKSLNELLKGIEEINYVSQIQNLVANILKYYLLCFYDYFYNQKNQKNQKLLSMIDVNRIFLKAIIHSVKRNHKI